MTFPVSRRLNAERLALLGWSRAILLQLAHPLVAAGVAEHSSFRASPFTAVRRLHQTVGAMLSLTFGSEPQRTATIEHIKGIHRRVNGTLSEPVGPFAAGTPYSAEDPALVIWVHATLLESIPLVHARLVEPIDEATRDDYCREAESLAYALGARGGVPRSWSELLAYCDRMYASGDIAVGPQARELADAVLSPPFAAVIAPAAHVNRLFAVGLLPEAVRVQYGFRWTTKDERALERWTRLIRRVRRWTPDALAQWEIGG